MNKLILRAPLLLTILLSFNSLSNDLGLTEGSDESFQSLVSSETGIDYSDLKKVLEDGNIVFAKHLGWKLIVTATYGKYIPGVYLMWIHNDIFPCSDLKILMSLRDRFDREGEFNDLLLPRFSYRIPDCNITNKETYSNTEGNSFIVFRENEDTYFLMAPDADDFEDGDKEVWIGNISWVRERKSDQVSWIYNSDGSIESKKYPSYCLNKGGENKYLALGKCSEFKFKVDNNALNLSDAETGMCFKRKSFGWANWTWVKHANDESCAGGKSAFRLWKRR